MSVQSKGLLGACMVGVALASTTLWAAVPRSTLHVLHSFAGAPDGTVPGGLMLARDGNFYGVTLGGGSSTACGSSGCGTFFRLSPTGVETVLYSFAGGNDGYFPDFALAEGRDGNFYGVTGGGGTGNQGTVFRMTPAGVHTVLHSFAGTADGAQPSSGLVLARDGYFYGTTAEGGTQRLYQCSAIGCGAVYRISPQGQESLVYSFGSEPDGRYPDDLIQTADGSLVGTTSVGGANGYGSLFRIAPDGTKSTVYSFDSGGNGPTGVIRATDGNYYVVTNAGGEAGYGAVFRITIDGQATLLYSFGVGSYDHGYYPSAGVMQGSDGYLYGTTYWGGRSVDGTVYRMTLSGAIQTLHHFSNHADGEYPSTGLIEGPHGMIYGTTSGGGSGGGGTVFRIRPPAP